MRHIRHIPYSFKLTNSRPINHNKLNPRYCADNTLILIFYPGVAPFLTSLSVHPSAALIIHQEQVACLDIKVVRVQYVAALQQ